MTINTMFGDYSQLPWVKGVERSIQSLSQNWGSVLKSLRLASQLFPLSKEVMHERLHSHLIHLIERGALCNKTGEFRKGLLQFAVREERWPLCRALIDEGIPLDQEIQEEIQSRLGHHGVLPKASAVFMQARPHPNCVEMFVENENHFQRLQSVAGRRFVQKPLALFILQDKSVLSEDYWAIGRKWGPEGHEWYKAIAKDFTVLRGSVSHKTGLAPITKHVKDQFPGVPLLLLFFDTHGTQDGMGMGSTLTYQDTSIFQETGKQVDPRGGVVLSACSAAGGDQRLIAAVSKSMPGRSIYGPSQLFNHTSFKISTDVGVPKFIPLFHEHELYRAEGNGYACEFRDGKLVETYQVPREDQHIVL